MTNWANRKERMAAIARRRNGRASARRRNLDAAGRPAASPVTITKANGQTKTEPARRARITPGSERF